jgi:hypothetical protein
VPRCSGIGAVGVLAQLVNDGKGLGFGSEYVLPFLLRIGLRAFILIRGSQHRAVD